MFDLVRELPPDIYECLWTFISGKTLTYGEMSVSLLTVSELTVSGFEVSMDQAAEVSAKDLKVPISQFEYLGSKVFNLDEVWSINATKLHKIRFRPGRIDFEPPLDIVGRIKAKVTYLEAKRNHLYVEVTNSFVDLKFVKGS